MIKPWEHSYNLLNKIKKGTRIHITFIRNISANNIFDFFIFFYFHALPNTSSFSAFSKPEISLTTATSLTNLRLEGLLPI